eukprot:COSAG01_NODE_160_length_23692_cov_9.703599_20_plen_85_part_00
MDSRGNTHTHSRMTPTGSPGVHGSPAIIAAAARSSSDVSYMESTGETGSSVSVSSSPCRSSPGRRKLQGLSPCATHSGHGCTCS